VPELNLPYPDAAKGSERSGLLFPRSSLCSLLSALISPIRILFGVPYGAPFNRKKFQGLDDAGYFITESACVRFVTLFLLLFLLHLPSPFTLQVLSGLWPLSAPHEFETFETIDQSFES
jgi:hypothetical protein